MTVSILLCSVRDRYLWESFRNTPQNYFCHNLCRNKSVALINFPLPCFCQKKKLQKKLELVSTARIVRGFRVSRPGANMAASNLSFFEGFVAGSKILSRAHDYNFPPFSLFPLRVRSSRSNCFCSADK